MRQEAIIIASCAVLVLSGSAFKLMLDVMLDKHLRRRYIISRLLLSLVVGARAGWGSLLTDYKPTEEIAPFLVLTFIGFALDPILVWLQHNGQDIVIDLVKGFFKRIFNLDKDYNKSQSSDNSVDKSKDNVILKKE